MLRKKIYKWHRTASLIIAIPVILWATSGFMHPIMTNFRPNVATQYLNPVTIDSSVLQVSLQEALQKNSISELRNFRIVHIDTNWFYQVQRKLKTPVYLSARNGKLLQNGDALYAQYIARQFLEGQEKPSAKAVQYASLQVEVVKPVAEKTEDPMHDCCAAATACILGSQKGAKVTSVLPVTSFTEEYKYINRLLPVYKVSFDRPDGIRLYVETTQDRFAFAVDKKRSAFDTFFGIFHTWEWMNALGNTKYYLMALITGTVFLTTLMGLYIFFTTKTKKSDNKIVRSRRNHRYTSLVASLFTLMFTFSGGYHALSKLKPSDNSVITALTDIPAGDIILDKTRLYSTLAGRQLQNISLIKMGDELCWQALLKPLNTKAHGNDLMKTMQVPVPDVAYVSAKDYTILSKGEERYARSLGTAFSNSQGSEIQSATLITKFTDEYGFINKRLPVWKISYNKNDHERYYVETATGALALRVTDNDVTEGYSFAFFHKHHFMDWGGKQVRDFSTMFWAAMQIAMVTVGLILWYRSVRKKDNNGVLKT